MSEEKTANAVERTFSILELIAESTQGLSNSDISRRLKLPKSSASYILRVMEKRGYLSRGDAGKYRLGLKIMSLSRGQMAHVDGGCALAADDRHLPRERRKGRRARGRARRPGYLHGEPADAGEERELSWGLP